MEKVPLRNWINLAVFDNVKVARALQVYLNKQGFDVRIHDERKLQRYWFLVRPHAGIQVQVSEQDCEAAETFLNIPPGANSHLQAAIRCPSCSSLRVQYPQMTRQFILPTLVAQTLVFLGIVERQNYCENCHHTWGRHSRRTKTTPARQKRSKAFAS